MRNRHVKFLVELAISAVNKNYYMAAGILSGSKLVSFETNDGLSHAETRACTMVHDERFRSYRSAKKFDLLIVRINNSGKLRNSKPCKDCLIHLRMYNINRIFYVDEDGELISEKMSEMTTTYVTGGKSKKQM